MCNIDKVRSFPGVTWMQADISDPSLLETVLAGTYKLFLLTGNRPGFGETLQNVIRTAESLGVKHVVKLSALGASPRTQSPLAYEHWLVEEALEKTSMTWTVFRPHVFMQNWLVEVADTVRSERLIYAAIGEGKVPFIDARDIAAVAAESLLHPEKHTGQKYVLTGREAIGYATLAEAISQAIDSPVKYKSLSMDEMRNRMEKQGVSTKMIDSYLALAAYQNAGGSTERISYSVKEVLSREARSVKEFAKDYRENFLK